jgi:hypothetical protein
MMSMSRFVRQTFEHIHKHKGAPNARVRGSDLQDLLLISPFIFDNLFQRHVESWNETHNAFVADPTLQILPILHTKLTFYQLYREDAKCVDEIHEMTSESKKFLKQCRETFRDFKNGAPGRQKHICSSNKMHRLVHSGEQVVKFGNLDNYLAMEETQYWARCPCFVRATLALFHSA